MKKLSATQQRVLEKITKEVNRAREAKTYEEWIMADEMMHDYQKEAWIKSRLLEHVYEESKRGEVMVQENTKTLKALEKMGLIEVLSVGGEYIDGVRLLDC